MTQYGDSSHLSSIYLVPVSNLNMKLTSLSAQRHTLYLQTAVNTSALINEIYYGIFLLESSSISYMFNIASQHGRGTGYFYIFSDKDDFSNFTSKVAGAEHRALFSRQLNIGGFNVTQPTSIRYPVKQSSYYFFVAELPGDVFYNFSYEIKDIHLSHLDYEPVCEHVYEPSNPCSITLPESGMFHILAYRGASRRFWVCHNTSTVNRWCITGRTTAAYSLYSAHISWCCGHFNLLSWCQFDCWSCY